MRFVKGHGTENDFVLIPPDEDIHLTEDVVRALCDRRRGIGADGVLAVVRTDDSADVRWFMDYRNADGSIAEMCGNGVRVFARYLVTEGFEHPGHLRIGTRAGGKDVDVTAEGDITVDMGHAERLDDAKVTLGGAAHDAQGWSMGNPHLVILDAGDLDEVDLSSPPVIEPEAAFTDGVNVEVVEPRGPGHLRMRVYERGVGETRSCGTGACAAAVAAMDADGARTTYIVDVPGGRLMVDWRPDGRVFLTGPAVLVARGETDVSPA
ncbi:MAG TPA: diaminopimelate epimerase [Nocardioidaceae bacterium]|nr:diaminopimelate epimerase [Nocardioidaceae bacterium]